MLIQPILAILPTHLSIKTINFWKAALVYFVEGLSAVSDDVYGVVVVPLPRHHIIRINCGLATTVFIKTRLCKGILLHLFDVTDLSVLRIVLWKGVCVLPISYSYAIKTVDSVVLSVVPPHNQLLLRPLQPNSCIDRRRSVFGYADVSHVFVDLVYF